MLGTSLCKVLGPPLGSSLDGRMDGLLVGNSGDANIVGSIDGSSLDGRIDGL
jgi:hypothetical protein